MSYNGPLWLNLVGSWVPRTSPHPRDTIRTPPMLEVARIRSRTSSDTFLSRFPPFFINLYIYLMIYSINIKYKGLRYI